MSNNTQQQVEKLRDYCGCSESAGTAMLGLVCYLFYRIFLNVDYTIGISLELVIGFSIFIGSGVVGKIVALSIARIKLKRILQHRKLDHFSDEE